MGGAPRYTRRMRRHWSLDPPGRPVLLGVVAGVALLALVLCEWAYGSTAQAPQWLVRPAQVIVLGVAAVDVCVLVVGSAIQRRRRRRDERERPLSHHP